MQAKLTSDRGRCKSSLRTNFREARIKIIIPCLISHALVTNSHSHAQVDGRAGDTAGPAWVGTWSSPPASRRASDFGKGRAVPECQWVSAVGGPTPPAPRDVCLTVQCLGLRQGPGHSSRRLASSEGTGRLRSQPFHRVRCGGPAAGGSVSQRLLDPDQRTSGVLGGSPSEGPARAFPGRRVVGAPRRPPTLVSA